MQFTPAVSSHPYVTGIEERERGAVKNIPMHIRKVSFALFFFFFCVESISLIKGGLLVVGSGLEMTGRVALALPQR